MMTPTTVAELLGGTQPALERALRDAQVAHTTLHGVAAAALPLFDERVADVLEGLLAIDLGALVLDGWTRYRELTAAAERTREAPAEPEDVVLVEHEIISEHHPAVEVMVDGMSVATLEFDVVVSLVLRGVVAVVERGRLVAVRSGAVEAGATLSLAGRELAAHNVECFAGALLQLRTGFELVGQPAPTPPWWEQMPQQRTATPSGSRERGRTGPA